MPYIEKKRRTELLYEKEQTPGELNYQLTRWCKEYLYTKGKSYQTYNDIIGALECCKLEIYRRLIASYEDKKCELNGDVYSDE